MDSDRESHFVEPCSCGLPICRDCRPENFPESREQVIDREVGTGTETREQDLERQVVALTVVLRRTKRHVEAGDPTEEILRGIGNGLGLFGASNLAVELWEKDYGHAR